MKSHSAGETQFDEDSLTTVPQTLEGWSVLHQVFRIKWAAWKALDAAVRERAADEAASLITQMERAEDSHSAAFSILGHRGDLMLLHFRRSFDDLSLSEAAIANLTLGDFLEPATSYLSVVEIGLYELSVRLYASLAQRGLKPGSPEWRQAVDVEVAGQRDKMKERLYPKIPPARYLCFYPMDKKRGEQHNWYLLPIDERRRMMHEHGLVGRRFAGVVTQIISGSTGFDDWEWGVDLFAEDPLVFKKLIYEMRFDEASAIYALFGPFQIGIRRSPAELRNMLVGQS